MAAIFIGLWIAGGLPAGILGEVVQAESPRTRRAGRIAFAFLLWIDLLVAALVLAVGADAPTSHMTKGLWWFTIIVAGIPLALVSGLAVRRGYAGHRFALAAATPLVAGNVIVGTGQVASTATTAVVSDSARRASSSASALRLLAAASAFSSSSSWGFTPIPAAHSRPTRRRKTCST
jgi:hypothetical protein